MSKMMKVFLWSSVAFFLFMNASLGYAYLVHEYSYPADRLIVKTILGFSVITMFVSTVLIGVLGLITLNAFKTNDNDLGNKLLSCVFILITICGILAFPLMGICEIVFGTVPQFFCRFINDPLFLGTLVCVGIMSGFIMWTKMRRSSWISFLAMLLCAYSFFISRWFTFSILYAI